MIEIIGAPKEIGKIGLDKFRWLSLTPVLQKLYLRFMLETSKRYVNPYSSNVLGFEAGRSPRDVVGIAKQVIFKAYDWGLPLFIAGGDVKHAFDQLRHGHVYTALQKRGLHPTLIRALMSEMSNLEATVTIPGATESEPIRYDRGGRQGGVDTPFIFNQVVDAALEETVQHWRINKFGFEMLDHLRLGDVGSLGYVTSHLSHLIWADN
eukprot:2447523-Karenia_brevis.AAC.1